MSIPGLHIIGERINPGFRSTQQLFDDEDIPGIQELARRQAEAGAICLNVNVGTRALTDPAFFVEVIRAIQAVVDLPLSFDCPDLAVQELALKAYDPAKAAGRKPVVNSIAETRWEMAELVKIRPCKVILMSSDQLIDGRMVPSKRGEEVHEVTRRMVRRFKAAQPELDNDDFFVDVSIAPLAADTEGLTRMALDGVHLVGADPELKGIHIMGGLSNLPQQLPPKTFDGADLRHAVECAFLTVAVPLGFDTVLGTPWRNYEVLPEDDFVLGEFRQILDLKGAAVLKRVRNLYRKAA